MKDFVEFLPPVYRTKYIKSVLRAVQVAVKVFFEDVEKIRKEYNVETATYTLPYWAEMTGAHYNVELSDAINRGNILAKMKGNGTITEKVIKSVVESYSNATCEVIQDYNNYAFHVRIIDKIGVPEKDSEIKRTVDELKPAHLAWDITYKYRTWGELEALGKPWEYYEDKGYTWADLRERSEL